MADTYEIALDGVNAEDFAALVGGLGYLALIQVRNAPPGTEEQVVERAHELNALSERLLVENTEPARAMLLDPEVSQFIDQIDLPDEVLEAIDVRIEDGQVIDTRA